MKKNTWPSEVKEYFENGIRQVKKVWALKPYVIVAEFDDGVCKSSDMASDLYGVMSVLKDYEIFKKVCVDDDGCIAWNTPNGHIDISKDTVYIYGDLYLGDKK